MDTKKTQSGQFPQPEKASDPKVLKTLDKVGCQPYTGETMVLEIPSRIEFAFGTVHKCSVVVTNQRLIFCDHDNKQHSFELSRDELESSTFKRFYGRHLTIKTKAGTEHLIRLDKGNIERLVAAIGRELPPNTTVRDFAKGLLAFIPLLWLAGGAFLADANKEYATVIIGFTVGVPLLLCGFFFGRSGTVFVVGISAIVAVLNAIDGIYQMWVGVVVLLLMGGLSLVGEIVRAAQRGASQQADEAAQ